MKQLLLKATTLFFFVACISIFVAYRSGKNDTIENIIQSSSNGGSINNTSYNDSLLMSDSLQMDLMMYSSKSMILIPPALKFKDTSHTKNTDTLSDTIIENFMLMGGSKSMRIVDKPFMKDTSKKQHNSNSKK